MAHELELTAQGAAFAYVGKNGLPWHKLGTAVADNLTPDEIAEAAQLTWGLEKSPVYSSTGSPIEGFYELRRTTDKRSYDIVSNLYKPFQPKSAVAFFAKFVQAGQMKMETCGSLQDGRRIFATAKLNEGFTLKGGDRVEGYLLLSSPNYAGEAAVAKFTGVRTVCANTHRMALRDAGAMVRINHLNDFTEGVQNTLERLALVLGVYPPVARVCHDLARRNDCVGHDSVAPTAFRFTHF